MNFDELSSEMQEKVRACKSSEEILALAKEEGYVLSDHELNAISGGGVWDTCSSPYYCDADAGCIGRIR